MTTRDRLLDVAEELFGRHGIHRVTSREIVEAAGQRNTSAVTYHFGSREGLVLEILARRGGPVDAERGRLRASLDPSPTTRALVACLVDPYLALLADPGGRAYLQIVAQLRGRFAAWRVESDAATTANLASILDELETRAGGGEPVRRERIVAMIMLLTAMAAERARLITEHAPIETDPTTFRDDVNAMCAAVLSA